MVLDYASGGQLTLVFARHFENQQPQDYPVARGLHQFNVLFRHQQLKHLLLQLVQDLHLDAQLGVLQNSREQQVH